MADKKPARRRNPNGSGTISQRKDGRFQLRMFVDAPDGTRKRITFYGDTWEAADNERTRLKELQRRGVPVDITTATVGEYLRHWLVNVAQPEVRPTTYVTYELLVRLYMVPGLGKRKLRALQADHIRTWLNGLRTRCQCCAQGKDAKRAESGRARCCAKVPAECCESYPSTGTLRALLRVLRAALQDAVETDMLARNVARQVKMPTGHLRKEKPWNMQEAARFLEAAQDHRLYALWSVALAVGLRRGEALGLRWTDVDLIRGTLNLEQALYRVGGELGIHALKTDSSAASIPLPSKLVEILVRHKREQFADKELREANKLGLVFTSTRGTPLEPRNVNRVFADLVKKAGVRPIRLHDLRHSCATLLFTMGVDAATVQRILRHSSITVTTGVYLEVIEQVQREAVAGMDDLFA
ncbi:MULTISPECIES: tyrosine-type recombinase/integrase [Nocardia]|uniref:tyrosine-type recombinase/integrase n=3 Tax=Nocardiaceae TaxID=85025 RepID=UPI0009ED2AED|nr:MULTISPECIES: site-specific integrase [Nocardia]